jgi:hypothetical protein
MSAAPMAEFIRATTRLVERAPPRRELLADVRARLAL